MPHTLPTAPDAQTRYPARYYAAYDTTAPQPTQVTGWYDTWDMSSLNKVPPASDMIPMTESQWATHFEHLTAGVSNGQIVNYTPPPYVLPLAEQATTALARARRYVSENYTMLNEPTPSEWITYLKALMAIADGTDTQNIELPKRPN